LRQPDKIIPATLATPEFVAAAAVKAVNQRSWQAARDRLPINTP